MDAWQPQWGFSSHQDGLLCMLAAVYTDNVSSDSTSITHPVNCQPWTNLRLCVCVYIYFMICTVCWNMSWVTPRLVVSALQAYLYFCWFCISKKQALSHINQVFCRNNFRINFKLHGVFFFLSWNLPTAYVSHNNISYTSWASTSLMDNLGFFWVMAPWGGTDRRKETDHLCQVLWHQPL